jgi:SAM-dependent methyltransferase
MLDEAMRLDRKAGVDVEYVCATAEATGLPSSSFDVMTAGVCWHGFDADQAATEASRLLVPGGRPIIADIAWLPLPGSVVEATENLIRKHNPNMDDTVLRPARLAGTFVDGIDPLWFEGYQNAAAVKSKVSASTCSFLISKRVRIRRLCWSEFAGRCCPGVQCRPSRAPGARFLRRSVAGATSGLCGDREIAGINSEL